LSIPSATALRDKRDSLHGDPESHRNLHILPATEVSIR
jgi:hypothetical protein